MSDLDEIRNRMDVVEAEVAQLREDAAATRTLAAMADRDASEVKGVLRAHTQALSALRETQVEQSHTLETLAEAVGGLVTTQHALIETVGDLAGGQHSLAEVQQRQNEDLAEMKTMLRRLTDQS